MRRGVIDKSSIDQHVSLQRAASHGLLALYRAGLEKRFDARRAALVMASGSHSSASWRGFWR